MIKIKRVYEAPADSDGFRVLVDRLWPRGLSKNAARVDCWMKEIAPSAALRIWFAHDPVKWAEFQKRYGEELASKPELVADLLKRSEKEDITLLFYRSRHGIQQRRRFAGLPERSTAVLTPVAER